MIKYSFNPPKIKMKMMCLIISQKGHKIKVFLEKGRMQLPTKCLPFMNILWMFLNKIKYSTRI